MNLGVSHKANVIDKPKYDFIIDAYSHYFFEPHSFPTVRAHYLHKGLTELGYSCFLRKRIGKLDRALRLTRFTSLFYRYLRQRSLPPGRFLIHTYYQMPINEWEYIKPEYEQAAVSYFFNLQDFSIGDETHFYAPQTKWFREHGANLCHTVSERRKSDKEFCIGTGVDSKLFKPAKKKTILVEFGYKANRKKIDWRTPTISAEVINKALPQFQSRGYEIAVCGNKLDDVPFSFKPDKVFRYSSHCRFAKLLSEACIYVAMNESYGLSVAEAQMAGTVLVLMKGNYNKQLILTELFTEYEGARFENGRFMNINQSAASLETAIETAIDIAQVADCPAMIRSCVLKEFDYREQAKKVAAVCLAVANSNDKKDRL